jgi:8-oxo-dGTP pyrophosphatase MutT (NUDIX family)
MAHAAGAAEVLMSDLLLGDHLPLRLSDSVGVVIKTEDNKYLLQLRENQQGLYFPGFWGLFGGGVKPNEDPKRTAERELYEELGVRVGSLELVMRFDFDFLPMGHKKIGRWFYSTRMSDSVVQSIRLNEGVDVKAFSPEQALELRMVYFDAFAIWAIESGHRLISKED